MFQSKTVNSSTVAYSLFSLAFGKRMLIFSFSFWLVGILSEIFNHNIKYTVGIQVPYNAALTFIWDSPQISKELNDWAYLIPRISKQANTQTETEEILLV